VWVTCLDEVLDEVEPVSGFAAHDSLALHMEVELHGSARIAGDTVFIRRSAVYAKYGERKARKQDLGTSQFLLPY